MLGKIFPEYCMLSIRHFPYSPMILAAIGSMACFIGAAPEASAQALPSYIDCSIASLSGSSQALLSGTSSNRKYLGVFNTGNANIGLNVTGGTALIGGTGTITIPPGAGKEYSLYGHGLPFPPFNIINVIGTSGQSVTCHEGK
jgi:hypothetical protein